MFASNLSHRDRKPKYLSKFWTKHCGGHSPHSPSLRFGLPAPQPSRRHHAQSLLGPSFHDPRTHHVLESHPEQAAPLSRRDDERCHAIGSHSALALRLYLAAYNTSSSWRFWVLTISAPIGLNRCASILQPAAPPQVVAFESKIISAPICLNRFTLAESWKSDLWTCVCVLLFPFLSLLCVLAFPLLSIPFW